MNTCKDSDILINNQGLETDRMGVRRSSSARERVRGVGVGEVWNMDWGIWGGAGYGESGGRGFGHRTTGARTIGTLV